MYIKNATIHQVTQALLESKYGQNLEFREGTPDWRGTKLRVRLGVKNSHGEGASVKRRYDFNGFQGERHLRSACWHAHGRFFDTLFALCPEAVVEAMGKKITKDSGNWEDYNVGSMMFPIMASESCDCV